jgi:predicted amidohydrolase YtcJ
VRSRLTRDGAVLPLAGRRAHAAVLDLDPHDITNVQVDLTVFDGRVVHER